ncbi:MAG: 1,4-dihydroxy-2-naphthoate octaprenyltransferase [Porphyromonadaceae bacterium]|nr:1,4-dihydroxy-2-naphthoate octaprenyltransferase [Porphyromonadaceae bacterium]
MQARKTDLWLGLLRPKTLFSGLSAVLVPIAYALFTGLDTGWMRPLLLASLACSAQISSNIANDLIDYRRGVDTDQRLGPLRPLSKGLMTEGQVRAALAISLVVVFASGVALLVLSSWLLSMIALLILLGIFAYSGGPYPLSHHGLGEVAVIVFFGWIPVVVSYYILGGNAWDSTLWHLATAIGLSSANILLVNNYRDYKEDLRSGKRTIVVRLGRDIALKLYLSFGMLSIGLLYPIYSSWGMLVLMPYILLFTQGYSSLVTSQGEQLNRTLAMTARNTFFLSILVCTLLILK